MLEGPLVHACFQSRLNTELRPGLCQISFANISIIVCYFHIALDFHIKSTFVVQIQDQDHFTNLCISPRIFTMILEQLQVQCIKMFSCLKAWLIEIFAVANLGNYLFIRSELLVFLLVTINKSLSRISVLF